MLDEAVERLPGQVQAVEIRVVALQLGDQPQTVAVVVEAAEIGEAGVERVLAGVAERSVAEVVAEGDRLGEVLIERERAGERAGELRDFDRMGQAGAKVIAFVVYEHLRLMREAAERRRMDDAVAVALKSRARRRLRLGARRPREARVDGKGERGA